jgi:catechol 2,3-dioxygenase-like lactoylglutathione lyase family enzyme
MTTSESTTGETQATTPFGLGLHHVQLSAPPGAEDAAREFWVRKLGFTELPKPSVLAARGGIWVRADDLELHIGIVRDFAPARKAHPGILVRDLDALAERMAAHGIDVTWDDAFPGMRRFYAADPHGNRLEFLSPS